MGIFLGREKAVRKNLINHVRTEFDRMIDEIYSRVIKMIEQAEFPGVTRKLCESTSKGKVNEWKLEDKAHFFSFFETEFALLDDSGDEDSISRMNLFSKFHKELQVLVEDTENTSSSSPSFFSDINPIYAKLAEMQRVADQLPSLKITQKTEVSLGEHSHNEDELNLSSMDISNNEDADDGSNLSDLDVPIDEDIENDSTGGGAVVYSGSADESAREVWKRGE